MPELPEVETIRRDLEREVVGKRIKTVEVTGTRSIRRHKNKKDFIEPARGRQDQVGDAGQVPAAARLAASLARRPPRA